jgi:hypothetical protein
MRIMPMGVDVLYTRMDGGAQVYRSFKAKMPAQRQASRYIRCRQRSAMAPRSDALRKMTHQPAKYLV